MIIIIKNKTDKRNNNRVVGEKEIRFCDLNPVENKTKQRINVDAHAL